MEDSIRLEIVYIVQCNCFNNNCQINLLLKIGLLRMSV